MGNFLSSFWSSFRLELLPLSKTDPDLQYCRGCGMCATNKISTTNSFSWTETYRSSGGIDIIMPKQLAREGARKVKFTIYHSMIHILGCLLGCRISRAGGCQNIWVKFGWLNYLRVKGHSMDLVAFELIFSVCMISLSKEFFNSLIGFYESWKG